MNQVVSLLLCVTSARGLYDGREGRAIDFDAGPSSRQQFNLNDLTPAENDIVYTKFNIIGLNDLDSLPPVNIKSINNVRTVKRKPSVGGNRAREPAPARPRFSARPQPSVPAAPAVPAVRNNGHGGPQFRGAPPPHHPERNIFNFQPFPRVFNPWHNFYNFAKRPFQDATERNFQEEGRRSEIVTTPHTTARPTTTTKRSTTTTTTTTTAAPVAEEYDYHYYDYSSSNSVDTPHHTGHSFNQQSKDHPASSSSPGDYSYSDPGNSLDEDYSYTEYTEYQEETDQGINTLTGCPGSLRDCLSACSPVVRINGAAYKICVNECLERC